MLAIFRRELHTYFRSPLGYIYLAIIYFFGGQLFSSMLAMQANAIANIFSSLFSYFLFTTPILTMRLMSEDKRLKTDQALLTAPVSLGGIVWGKFLAAFALFGVALLCTVFYFLVTATMGEPMWNIFFGNLLGLALLGGALISIGLFISSLTESQMVAAIGGFAAMFFVFLIDSIGSVIPVKWISTAVTQLSFSARYSDFTMGILDFSHVLFFVSVMVVFNFLTIRVLEKKRWS